MLLTKVWADKYEKFNQTHPKGHFMQSLAGLGVKSFWKNEIIIAEDDNQEIAVR